MSLDLVPLRSKPARQQKTNLEQKAQAGGRGSRSLELKTSYPMTYPERLVSVHARLLKEGKLYQGQG